MERVAVSMLESTRQTSLLTNYPANIWLITEQDAEQFIFSTNGGIIIYIAEDVDPRFINNPCIVTAGVLNPPVAAIHMELDGNIEQANIMYDQYLMSEEIEAFVRIIMAACVKNKAIAIMFGKDELNMKSPSMFINFLFKRYGIVVGIKDKIMPYIDVYHMPDNLATLYCTNMIDYPSYLCMHPDLPLSHVSLPKLILEESPAIDDRTFPGYIEYFEHRRRICAECGTFIMDPLRGV